MPAVANVRRPLVLAGASGGATDKLRALSDLAQIPEIDVIVGDWMSEANMTVRGIEWAELKARRATGLDEGKANSGQYLSNTQDAFDPYFLTQLEPALPHLAKNGIKLACNAGGSNPAGLARAVKTLINKLGLALKVAWVEGDDVSDTVFDLHRQGEKFPRILDDLSLSEWGLDPISAQCYLGGTGVARAFEAYADIVVCGRIADASACVGACMWWHGWTRDDLDEMAAALIAGHLTECSTYVTGGCYAGFKNFGDNCSDLGCPIAYIGADGSIELTMEQNKDGEVSFGTVASQLVYEIQGPLYYNSDIIAKMEGLKVRDIGPNRVLITGAKGLPAPATTKVGISAKAGYKAEFHYYITGLDVAEKVNMVRCQTEALAGPDLDKMLVLDFQVAGSVAEDPQSQDEATVDLRIFAQTRDASVLGANKFLVWCKQNILQSYPGCTPNTDLRQGVGRPYFDYFVTMLNQEHVKEEVHLPDGTVEIMPPPTRTSIYSSKQDSYDTTDPLPLDTWGPTTRAPLGYIVLGRSGDKSSDANTGFIARSDDEFDWMRSLLSLDKFKDLLAKDYTGKPIERFEMPGLRAVHFLLKDHLKGGCNSTAGFDAYGKNLAEYIRAKHVDIPTKFLDRGRI